MGGIALKLNIMTLNHKREFFRVELVLKRP